MDCAVHKVPVGAIDIGCCRSAEQCSLQPPDDALRPVQSTRNGRIESMPQSPSTPVVMREWPIATRRLIPSHKPDATPHPNVVGRGAIKAGARRSIRACR